MKDKIPELWSLEWFERARERADSEGIKWVKPYEEYDTIVASYPEMDFHYPAFEDIKGAQDTVRGGLRTLEFLTGEKGPYCLVGRGSSGLFLSTLVAMERPKSDIVWFRKETDVDAHTGSAGHMHLSGQKPVLLFDDLVCTGETLLQIQKCMDVSRAQGASDYSEVDYLIVSSHFCWNSTWKSIIQTLKPKIVICGGIEG